ncbi:hypothetical protein NDU88_002278 [Pleurodeles waltl]|uniref:Uncharacterized protein n=1 Tax=Pleurodeles waltl TaxID=8319 RepID=A0AAV7T237_PLEWA|nr:hypothetical protein NDU88_002278 [Pleurodeles waltl]
MYRGNLLSSVQGPSGTCLHIQIDGTTTFFNDPVKGRRDAARPQTRLVLALSKIPWFFPKEQRMQNLFRHRRRSQDIAAWGREEMKSWRTAMKSGVTVD